MNNNQLYTWHSYLWFCNTEQETFHKKFLNFLNFAHDDNEQKKYFIGLSKDLDLDEIINESIKRIMNEEENRISRYIDDFNNKHKKNSKVYPLLPLSNSVKNKMFYGLIDDGEKIVIPKKQSTPIKTVRKTKKNPAVNYSPNLSGLSNLFKSPTQLEESQKNSSSHSSNKSYFFKKKHPENFNSAYTINSLQFDDNHSKFSEITKFSPSNIFSNKGVLGMKRIPRYSKLSNYFVTYPSSTENKSVKNSGLSKFIRLPMTNHHSNKSIAKYFKRSHSTGNIFSPLSKKFKSKSHHHTTPVLKTRKRSRPYSTNSLNNERKKNKLNNNNKE
jgi:hypothetical protein